MKFDESKLRAAGFVPDGNGGWFKPPLDRPIKPEHAPELSHLKKPPLHESSPKAATPPGPGERVRALGRMKAGMMNKTETSYSEHLARLKGVVWTGFEAITLKLAHDTRYTPDFMVMLDSGIIEFHEVKGFWTDDAKVKIKVAAEKFPMFRFCSIHKLPMKKGGGWLRVDFSK